MSIEEVREIMDRWFQVWNERRLDLVTETLGASYTRHEADGTRSVTAEQYRDEIAATQKRIPDVHFQVHDEAITDNTIWMRWTRTGTNAETGEMTTRAGLQIYRIADGRIVETWLAVSDSDWDD